MNRHSTGLTPSRSEWISAPQVVLLGPNSTQEPFRAPAIVPPYLSLGMIVWQPLMRFELRSLPSTDGLCAAKTAETQLPSKDHQSK